MGFAACRKQDLTVNGANVRDNIDKQAVQGPVEGAAAETDPAPAPTGEPVPIEVADGLTTRRQYVQTRSVLPLVAQSPEITEGMSLTIDNQTTGARLAEGRAVDLGAEAAALGRYGLLVSLVPGADARQFAYGENTLKLLADAETAPKVSQNKVYLRDFHFQALGTSAFVGADATQRQGGFQGRVSTVIGPSVSNGQGLWLTTGSISVLNQ